MAQGRIEKWTAGRSYDFIKEDGGGDVFFLHHEFQGDSSQQVSGQRVEFEKVPSTTKPGSFQAQQVRPIETGLTSSTAETNVGTPLVSFSHFHNPYTFVPTPQRPISACFAGNYDPLAHGLTHDGLQKDRWTGRIPIKLTTVTPLLLPDENQKTKFGDEGHFLYKMLNHLPESTLRGMLRSGYEIATNSRYSCFRNSDRLAYRMETEEGAPLIPAIIEPDATGKLVGRLYTGSGSTPAEKGPIGSQYAAMLSRYFTGRKSSENSVCDGAYDPRTGDEVWAEIVLCKHEVRDKKTKCWKENYRFWKVVKVWPKEKYSSCPSPSGGTPWPDPSQKCQAQKFYEPVNPLVCHMVEGKVLITNQNMTNKHDERIFFGPASAHPVEHLKDAWRMRIKGYREAHREDEIFGRKKGRSLVDPWCFIERKPGKTAWSPPLYQDGSHKDRWRRSVHDAAELESEDMVYARCTFAKGTITGIKDLFPVMISRNLYDASPEALLDASLRPAKRLVDLSPADRLFGWVAQKREGEKDAVAYKGRVRVVCEDGPNPAIIQPLEGDPLPLPILGQPKPAQGRFYVAKDKNGTPQEPGGRRADKGYDRPGTSGLRGRKQYWHHASPGRRKAPDYWKPSTEDRTQETDSDGRYQEFRRPDKEGENAQDKTAQRDSQNRSIKGWIKPETEFHATLHVQNLLREEIGALLWLLSLADRGCHFRLGYGKPLGFGSVTLELDPARLVNGCLPLGTGEDWKVYYESLGKTLPCALDKVQQEKFISCFKASIVAAYDPLPVKDAEVEDAEQATAKKDQRFASFEGLKDLRMSVTNEDKEKMESARFDELNFIKGFVQVLRGPTDDSPIHYPRVRRIDGTTSPDPQGENFKWFGENDDREGLSLPAVDDDRGLPYYTDSKSKKG